MRSSILFLLSLGLPLFSSSGAMSASTPVLDSDGDALQGGNLYYAVFQFYGVSIAGLKLSSTNNSCPLNVDFAWFGVGVQPVAFFPEDSKEDTVREGNTLYAMFAVPTECPESTVWKRGPHNTLTTGGTASSSAGPHNSRFAIAKSGEPGDGYTFQYCPCSVGANRPSCNTPCNEGLKVNSAAEKLPLRAMGDGHPTGFFFKKVKKGDKESWKASATLKLFES